MTTFAMTDTHCHLTFPPLGENLSPVLERAAAAGVTRIIVPAYDPESWPAVESLAAAHPDTVHPAYGLHPWQAHQPLDLDHLANLLRHPATIAVGEIGLDGKVESPTVAEQLPVLEQQLALAHDLDLPVILHCRGAFDELLAVLGRFTPHLRGVVHAWSRSPELARRFLKLGLHLGMGGAVTRPNARQVHEVVRTVPLESLLLETDAPAIGLHGVDPIATEPRHVRDVAQAMADLRGDTLDHVAERTTAAAARLFGI